MTPPYLNKGETGMPTSSITKEFILKDNKTADRLISILSEKKPRRKKPTSNKYEEGKILLEQHKAIRRLEN